MDVIAVSGRDGWAQAVGRSFYPLAVARADESFTASIRQTTLSGGISVAEVTCEENRLHRTTRMLREAPNDDVLLLVQLSGESVVTQRDREARVLSGSATLCDPLVEYEVASSRGSHQLVLMLPRATVRALAAPVDSLRLQVLEPRTLALRALTAVCEEVVSQDAHDPFERDSVSAVVADLARSALVGYARASAPSRSREELAARAREFIREHHRDGRVTGADVAEVVGVSERSLASLLRDAGGARTMLRSARLGTARRMLTDPGLGEITIGEIAARSGFADATTFIRAFRREFGILPSEAREGSGAHRD